MMPEQECHARGLIVGCLESGCETLDDIFRRTGQSTSESGVDEVLQLMLNTGELRQEGGFCKDGKPVRFYLQTNGPAVPAESVKA